MVLRLTLGNWHSDMYFRVFFSEILDFRHFHFGHFHGETFCRKLQQKFASISSGLCSILRPCNFTLLFACHQAFTVFGSQPTLDDCIIEAITINLDRRSGYCNLCIFISSGWWSVTPSVRNLFIAAGSICPPIGTPILSWPGLTEVVFSTQFSVSLSLPLVCCLQSLLLHTERAKCVLCQCKYIEHIEPSTTNDFLSDYSD